MSAFPTPINNQLSLIHGGRLTHQAAQGQLPAAHTLHQPHPQQREQEVGERRQPGQPDGHPVVTDTGHLEDGGAVVPGGRDGPTDRQTGRKTDRLGLVRSIHSVAGRLHTLGIKPKTFQLGIKHSYSSPPRTHTPKLVGGKGEPRSGLEPTTI